MSEKEKKEYDANSIKLLKFPENVRHRPGMYIGGSSIEGMHHLIWEIFDNSVDEAVAGFCSNIVIKNESDGFISVLDNGRGIPCEINRETKRSALELVFTELHAGGKFNNDEKDSGYATSGGLHGVGASVTMALSEKLIVYVKRNEKIYTQEYAKGYKTCDVHEVKEKDCPVTWTGKTGTFVKFKPDKEIFKHVEIKFEMTRVIRRAREIAFLVPKLTVEVKGWTGEDENDIVFRFDDGLTDYINYHLDKKERLVEDFEMSVNIKELGCTANVAFTYEKEYDEHVATFANNIATHEGGVHREAFLTSLLKVITEIGEKEKLLQNFEGNVKKSDVCEGLFAIVSVYLKQPEFEGQTKTKLGNPEIRGPLEDAFTENLHKAFSKRKEDLLIIANKVIEAIKARDAARKAKDLTRKKGGLEHFTLQGKLSPCESKNPEECEVYLVEGVSAGGSAKQGRNKRFQAILPFKGKVINSEKHEINKTMVNKEIMSLITALRVKPSRNGTIEEEEMKNLRYHKIILASDADPDGSHILCLMITFFFKFMRTLIEEGHVYISLPPLFRLRKGSKSIYLKDDEELDRFKEKNDMSSYEVSRFKGLGEMNPAQLAETVMNPSTRSIVQITIEDAIEANKTIEALMGDDIEGRKNFLFKELALSDELI
jgi:DNA gyrase subunit B